jgi:hypothetical protein
VDKTEVDALPMIQQYSAELAQERHDRIFAQCAQRQVEAENVRLRGLLEMAGIDPDPAQEEPT